MASIAVLPPATSTTATAQVATQISPQIISTPCISQSVDIISTPCIYTGAGAGHRGGPPPARLPRTRQAQARHGRGGGRQVRIKLQVSYWKISTLLEECRLQIVCCGVLRTSRLLNRKNGSLDIILIELGLVLTILFYVTELLKICSPFAKQIICLSQ